MSYNVDHIEIIENENAHFILADWEKMMDEIEDDLPESSFTEKMADHRGRPKKVSGDKVPIEGESFWWSGEGSGSSWDTFEKKVLPRVKGELELLVIWEGGDSTEIVTVKNGKVTKEDAKARLRKARR